MKPVLVSQRVDVISGRNERRDALDQRLAAFLLHCGLLPLPVPNVPEAAKAMLVSASWYGVVLSGGNDLHALGGDAPERDAVESLLVSAAIEVGRPVIGICRGLQFLVYRDGGTLMPTTGHAATRHRLNLPERGSVNSYHRWIIKSLPESWRSLAQAPDATVEWGCSPGQNLWGVMWHPERETVWNFLDAEFFRNVFGAGAVL